MSNLEKSYEQELRIHKERLELLKEEKVERILFNLADFLINKAVPIMNIINLLDEYERKGKKNLIF